SPAGRRDLLRPRQADQRRGSARGGRAADAPPGQRVQVRRGDVRAALEAEVGEAEGSGDQKGPIRLPDALRPGQGAHRQAPTKACGRTPAGGGRGRVAVLLPYFRPGKSPAAPTTASSSGSARLPQAVSNTLVPVTSKT